MSKRELNLYDSDGFNKEKMKEEDVQRQKTSNGEIVVSKAPKSCHCPDPA